MSNEPLCYWFAMAEEDFVGDVDCFTYFDTECGNGSCESETSRPYFCSWCGKKVKCVVVRGELKMYRYTYSSVLGNDVKVRLDEYTEDHIKWQYVNRKRGRAFYTKEEALDDLRKRATSTLRTARRQQSVCEKILDNIYDIDKLT